MHKLSCPGHSMEYAQVNGISFGHLRLSIIDPDHRSDQPMVFEDLHMVYNGEICNYLSIKEELERLGYQIKTTSDTEVLRIGYKEWRSDLIPKLNGMFDFFIYDLSSSQVLCARDQLGIKPFFLISRDDATASYINYLFD